MRRNPLAVIDIGSNTIRSLIVEILPDGTYRVLDDEREVARLASGLSRSGRLSDSAIRRAVKALGRMADIARARGVRRPTVVATSALRNASNQRAFISRVLKETGLSVQVISGAEEARLAFESAALSFDLSDRPCAVADVGGGSSEVILALGHNIQHIHSLPLGSVALTEEFIHSDPVRRKEFKALRSEVRHRLREAGVTTDQPLQILIASGGTASSLAQILMAFQGLPGRPSHGFEMTQAQLLHMREALLRRTLAERRELPGLSADRADIILAGATILYELLSLLKVNVLRVSTRGIRHALLQRLITGGTRLAVAPPRPRRLEAAVCFARTLRFEQKHGEQVQRIALSLFDQLAARLNLDPDSRDLLAAAALLHDVGYAVSFRQHHKHTYHLIAHAQLDGFSPAEREMIALVARYHRRSTPKKKHASWGSLPREGRDLVCRLSALLRIADALDRRHSSALKSIVCRAGRKRISLTLIAAGALEVETHAVEEKADLFRKVFGRELVLRTQRLGATRRPRAAGTPVQQRRASA